MIEGGLSTARKLVLWPKDTLSVGREGAGVGASRGKKERLLWELALHCNGAAKIDGTVEAQKNPV